MEWERKIVKVRDIGRKIPDTSSRTSRQARESKLNPEISWKKENELSKYKY